MTEINVEDTFRLSDTTWKVDRIYRSEGNDDDTVSLVDTSNPNHGTAFFRSNLERILAAQQTGETRVVSSTGAEKGQKLARYDLIPAGPLKAVAEHYGRGAAKYEDRNWEKGYPWNLSFQAMMRHAWAFWDGEDFDVDPQIPLDDEGQGSPHLAAVVFHAFALLEYMTTHPEFDNRPSSQGTTSGDFRDVLLAGMELIEADKQREPRVWEFINNVGPGVTVSGRDGTKYKAYEFGVERIRSGYPSYRHWDEEYDRNLSMENGPFTEVLEGN